MGVRSPYYAFVEDLLSTCSRCASIKSWIRNKVGTSSLSLQKVNGIFSK